MKKIIQKVNNQHHSGVNLMPNEKMSLWSKVMAPRGRGFYVKGRLDKFQNIFLFSSRSC